MAIIEYEMDENVAVVTMNSGENRFNYTFIDAFLNVLDEIEDKTEAKVLVVRSSHEKIFCNGVDLDWLLPATAEDPNIASEYPLRLCGLLKRIMTYPMITIAAVTGHAFAGGAILACAFDFRFMRSDRGFFCIPEIDIGIPLMPSMDALMRKSVPMYKFLEMQFSGNRYTGRECEEHHVVVKACPLDDLMNEVLAFAKGFQKDRAMIRIMKGITYKEIIRIMEEDDPAFVASGAAMGPGRS